MECSCCNSFAYSLETLLQEELKMITTVFMRRVSEYLFVTNRTLPDT